MSPTGPPAGEPPALPGYAGSPLDDPHAPWFTVGQVADALGVQAAFLRRLDTESVVQPARSAGGQRRYSRQEIDLVERVVQFAAEGFTLASIRRVLELEREVAELQRRLALEQAKRVVE